jgi:hypothetical protein
MSADSELKTLPQQRGWSRKKFLEVTGVGMLAALVTRAANLFG